MDKSGSFAMAALLALPFGAPSSAALQPVPSDAPGDLASPSILAAFYSYDGCVGASTLDAAELRSRRCTVLDDNSTNVRMVGDVMKLCASFCQSGLSGVSVDNLVSLDPWLDSLLVTLTHPVVESSIDKHDFKVVVWDEASKSSTEAEVKCVSLWPSGEGNELSTLNLIGDFGDGYGGTRWPTHLKIVRRRRRDHPPPSTLSTHAHTLAATAAAGLRDARDAGRRHRDRRAPGQRHSGVLERGGVCVQQLDDRAAARDAAVVQRGGRVHQ